MKRRMFGMLVVILVLLSGCQSGTDLDAYRAAVEKTDAATAGKSEFKLTINNEFHLKESTPESQKAMAFFERIVFSTATRFDETRIQSDLYLNFGGIGFDAAYYRDGELEFTKLPLVGKYMKLDEMDPGMAIDSELLESFDPIGEEWLRMMREENIFKGKRHVLSTADGDVKVTRFSIELTDEQIQQGLALIADVIEENEKEILASGFFGESSQENGHQLIQEAAENVRSVRFEDFVYTTDIDIDGYVIQSEFLGTLKVGDGEDMITRVAVRTLNWGFDQEPEFSIPTPEADEWADKEDLGTNAFFSRDILGK